MTVTMTVSPDFPPTHIAGWYIFNTWLQKELDISIHLALYENFEAQREAINKDEIDLIYANPFDASTLVRDKSFTALVKPENKSDEVIVAVSAESSYEKIEDLSQGMRIAKTDDPAVNMIGMMILEAADLNFDNTSSDVADTYTLVAKQLINGDADVGFFLKDAYDIASDFVKKQLKVLVRSEIDDICHVFMASPNFAPHAQKMKDSLMIMKNELKGQGVLNELGLPAWRAQDEEDTEFMIDLMDTLG